MSDEVEQAERLAGIERLALEHFKDAAKAQRWLTEPHMMLDLVAPVEVAKTKDGMERVIRLLGRAA
ncbi:antitoxin Xre/MbcA/ParS toxin-binding domain-containing protein, partial [Escherichia coli]|uniref:antitoxin Xre/MbcA/ParS toxin-binding domain-containing protein n=2 Tax=Pseudomonadota TaxID=1224 RepID=UPI0013D74603